MKARMFLLMACLAFMSWTVRADETVTVTAISTDISENLDLKTVATLFGQAKDLEEFEAMLNNPDSAFSNLDLNGDGQVDYLRVIETADGNRHLVVLQAVLAKDVYQDVASIYVEKDPETESVTVQVIGDEYIYGTNYIIEPVYVYRPYIYDWFWGPDWVCWYSPYYWDYWPGWWHPYYCVAPYIYWDHCYWHHHWHPVCSYRTGHHPHDHFYPMHDPIRRSDYAVRHPERSFATRNANRNVTNARSFEVERRASTRSAMANGNVSSSRNNVAASRNVSEGSAASRSFGSSNIRTSTSSATRTQASASGRTVSSSRSAAQNRVESRVADGTSRSTATSVSRTSSSVTTRTAATPASRSVSSTPTRSASSSVNSRVSNTGSRSSVNSTSVRTQPSTNMHSSSASMRSSSSSAPARSSGATMQSSMGGGMRSSGGSMSGGMSGGSRSSGGGSSRSGGGSRR